MKLKLSENTFIEFEDTIDSEEELSGTLKNKYNKLTFWLNKSQAIEIIKLLSDRFGLNKSDVDNWNKLKALCGYVQNSSETTVRLFQDDATLSCFVQVDKESNFGSSFEEALNKFKIRED